MHSLLKTHPLLKIASGAMVELPCPANITKMWNFGSLLGLCLGIQLLTGIFLAMHYSSDVMISFSSVSHIQRDVNYGWLVRFLHANGASLFFFCLYGHIARGMFFNSYKLKFTWLVGVTILLLTMATAFLGYVLPWGQMSFWGATVITNLFSAIPMVGQDIVYWLWGGFAVSNPTLTRFFSLHFLLPFVISLFSAIHLLFLHQTGSNNPLGVNSNLDKVIFHPYFSMKDILGMLIILMAFMTLVMLNPWLAGDPENFIYANPLVTPVHIQPEWYFLFAYAILRSIPNKLGGVIALVLSVAILYIMPFYVTLKNLSLHFQIMTKMMFWSLVNTFFILTIIGAKPVEDPYILIGQMFTVSYFLIFLLWPYTSLNFSKK